MRKASEVLATRGDRTASDPFRVGGKLDCADATVAVPVIRMLPAALAKPETRWRLLRFLTVGGTAYAVQWTAMKVFLNWLPENVAFTASFLCSSATHYSLNRFWALPSSRHDSWRQFAEYLGVVALSWAINIGLFRVCRDALGMGKLLATAVVVPPSTVVVFLLLNFRVFRKRNAGAP